MSLRYSTTLNFEVNSSHSGTTFGISYGTRSETFFSCFTRKSDIVSHMLVLASVLTYIQLVAIDISSSEVFGLLF